MSFDTQQSLVAPSETVESLRESVGKLTATNRILERRLRRRDEEISRKGDEICRRDDEIRRKDGVARRKDEEINALEQEIIDLNERLALVSRQPSSAISTRIAELEAELSLRDLEITKLTEKVHETNSASAPSFGSPRNLTETRIVSQAPQTPSRLVPKIGTQCDSGGSRRLPSMEQEQQRKNHLFSERPPVV